MKTRLATYLAAGAAFVTATSAQAQRQPAVRDADLATPSPDRPTKPPHEQSTASIAALEPLGHALRGLADDGVLLRATWTDEVAGNTSGGVHRGSTNTG
ncbi:MAG: hypothetical protein ACTHKR_15035, partial [Sphingomonas sp.]